MCSRGKEERTLAKVESQATGGDEREEGDELYGLSVTMRLLLCALEWVGQKRFEKMNSVACYVFKNLSMDTSL